MLSVVMALNNPLIMKIKKLNILYVALALLTFSSCKSLYGKYERPEVNTWSKDSAVQKDTTSFGNLAWKTVFTDPLLQNLVDTALQSNNDLLNAALNVKAAEAQLMSAKLSFLPSFVFSPQGTISSWDGNPATKTYQMPVSASWNIDLFGNLLSQKRASQMALLASKDYQLVVRTKLIGGVANLYYTLLMLDKQLNIVTSMEKLAKETLDMMVLQKQLGRVRSTAVQSAESNLYSVQSQKVDLIRQIGETENALSLLLGRSAQHFKRGNIDEQNLPTQFSTGIALNVLNNRPDVHAAEMALAQCFYNVQTARSRFYPNLTISGTGILTNSAGMGIVNPGKLLLNAVGSLVQPIFQKGQIVAGLKVAKIQYEKAYNTWQQMVLSAGSEVSNALIMYHSSNEKSALEAKRISILTQNVEDTKQLLQQSRSTYLEVITAQQALLNAETTKIRSDFNKMQAIVSLYQALGGGVK